MHELVIQGGRVALDDDWAECDVGIDGGRIAAIGARLQGKTSIDAAGKWVMPGGIDAHCHLDQPVWGGAGNADDFASGSISAAFGGTTCIVPFGMPGPDMTTVGAVDRAHGPRGRKIRHRLRPARRRDDGHGRRRRGTARDAGGARHRVGQAVHDL